MIDIKSYGVSQKSTKGGNTSTTITTGGSGESNFFPVYLWGQYFDDTKDIDGDMKVNGTIEADAIKTLELIAEDMSVDNLDVKERLTAAAGNIKDLETKNFKADKARLKNALIDELAASNLVAENLTVTGSAHFFELIIDKVRAAGGAILLSPADGFKIDKVEWIDSTHVKLWWRSEKDGRKIHNMWMTGDQAISQNFNDAKVGKTYDVSNKYWWALVTETNNDTNSGEPLTTAVNGEDVLCHYIIVSAAKNEFVGDVNPEVDDEVAMLGSRVNDENRQSAQYLAAYASLDIDLKAPLFAQYKGINDFDLASHKITWFAAGLTAAGVVKGLRENEITGSFRTSSGKSIEDLIKEAKASTTYRLVSNTTAIRKSTDGTLSPTTVSFSILMNDNGEVMNLDKVPDMMTVYINDANTNGRAATFSAGQQMVIEASVLADGHTNLIAVLADTTTGNVHDKMSITVIEDQNIDIDITGDITSFDRLVDNGCIAKVKFTTINGDESNPAVVTNTTIDFNLDVIVMHYEGTTANKVTTSTGYSALWEWDKQSNTSGPLSSGGSLTFNTSSKTWKASGNDIIFKMDSTSNDYKSYIKVILKKGGSTVDTLIVPLTVRSEAMLEIVQGSLPYIKSQVTASLQNGDFGELSNNISELLQTAQEIQATVTEFNESGISQSIMQQTSENVLLQVSNSLSTAGINITNNTITLTGDKTDINGSLNIYGGTGNGFKVWNAVKGSETKSVQILNKNLGAIQYYDWRQMISGNISSGNIIGMDGMILCPDSRYNQFLWWGESAEENKYEFIVRNKNTNFRIRENGIFRSQSMSVSASEFPNILNFSSSGRSLLDTGIYNESKWGDIATTTPVHVWYGNFADFTTNGNGEGGEYPDETFRKCGIFECLPNSNIDEIKVFLPNPQYCVGRILLFKIGNTYSEQFAFTTHNCGQIMSAEDSLLWDTYRSTAHRTIMLFSTFYHWIVFRSY